MKPQKVHNKATKQEKLERRIDVRNKRIGRMIREEEALNLKIDRLKDSLTSLGIKRIHQQDLRDKLIVERDNKKI